MARYPYIDELMKLATRAAGGDDGALLELGRQNERLGRALNQRMRVLERTGKTGDAYRRIEASLGRSRASQSRTGSAEELYRKASKALAGLNYKESTLSGIREVDTKTANSFARSMGIVGETEKLSKAQIDRLNRFVASDGWREIKRSFGSKTDQARDAVEMIMNDSDDAVGLLESMEDFENTDTDIFTTLEEWGIVF